MPNKTRARPFYNLVQPDSADGAAHLYIFGDIVESGYEWTEGDASPLTVTTELAGLQAAEIVVHIDSLGGDAAAGIAIYNALRSNPAKVTTAVEGFACSAASVVFAAGDVRRMGQGALLMIHNAWTMASGDAEELRKQAEALDKISDSVAAIYQSNSNLDAATIKGLMDSDTWISADEALAWGLATEIVADAPVEGYQSSAYPVIRAALLERCKPPFEVEPPTPEEPPEPPEPTQTAFNKVFGFLNRKEH